MAITRLADVIVPEVFLPYMVQQSTEKSALIQSGIVQRSPEFDALSAGPNTLINMPYFDDLTGDSETMDDTGYTVPTGIGTNKDVARKQGRVKSWGANGLSAQLSGADPMGAIANLVSNYWVREEQKIFLNMLNGVFASPSLAGHVLDISALTGGEEKVDGSSFVDATQLLGDAKDILTAVVMHSAVEAALVKRQLIEYDQFTNEIGQNIKIPYFMGKRVIVDDAMAYNSGTGVAEMFLFGEGAVAKGEGSHPNIVNVEVDRDKMALSGEDFLINRKVFMMHLRGVKWTESAVAGTFPTNTELATGSNYELVYDPKKIRVVKYKFKI